MKTYIECQKNTIIDIVSNLTDEQIINLIYGLLMKEMANREECPSTS